MTAISASQAPTHTESSTSKIETEIFYLTDQAGMVSLSGTYSVVVTFPTAPTGGAVAGCTSLFGVSQSGPEATATAYSGNGTAGTASVTTLTNGDWVLDAFGGGYTSSGSATPGSGQIQLYDLAYSGTSTAGSKTGVLGAGSYRLVSTAGTVTESWTETNSRMAYSVAAFPPAAVASYTVSTAVSPAGSGTVTLSPSQTTYEVGTSVTVTATPATYYSFSGFSGDVTGTSNPTTITVSGNTSITANFTVNTCTLTTSAATGGTISPSGTNSYPCGSVVTVTAMPNSGYNFTGFSGALSGTANPQAITLTGNQSVTANFVQGSICNLTTNVTGSGTISVSPSGTVFSCGTQLTLTATPSNGEYSFTGWSGALSGTTNPQSFTINSDSMVGAAFTQTNFPINVSAVGNGTVTLSPSASYYAQGTQVTLTAVPVSGSYFSAFSGDVTGTTNPVTVTVNSTMNVTATFITPQITLDASSSGATSAAGSTLSWQHTLGSGTSRALVIAVGEADSVASPDASAAVTSVTYNGIYATPLPGTVVYGGTSGMVQAQLFYLLDSELPTAGTYTVQVNLAGSIAGISAGAVSLFGVNQGPPEAIATNKVTSGANLISTAITTLSNNAWLIDLVEDGDTATLTANSGQTAEWQAKAALGTGGSSVKSVATAGATSVGWSGTANRLVEAVVDFVPASSTIPATYTLSTSVTPASSGTVAANPSLSVYPVGTGVLLTASSQVGYAFSGWSGDYSSTANPLPITMTGNLNIVANYTTAATCNLTVNIIGSGTLNVSSGTYNCGTVLTLNATPATGYSFTSYSGDFSSTDNPAYFTLSANSTINVEFDAIPQCTLTMSTVGVGTVTPSTATYACGTTVTISATAGTNYAFSGWTGDYTGTANPATIELDQSESITANFVTGNVCTLTTSVTGNGSISPNSGSYLCGDTITLAAIPNAHYSFSGWGGALSGTANPATLVLSSNETVTATFAYNTSGVTGDPRAVTEPTYPATVCAQLRAVQNVSSPVETSPDTTRVQAALNACPAGQAVRFSPSTDLSENAFIIAPITLPAGVTMLIDPEVTILGSIKYADYSCNTSESWCTPLITVAQNTDPSPGSAIMGFGVIDGRGGTTLTDKGESWWGTGSDTRPRLIYLGNRTTNASADDFTLYKITLKNSPKFHVSGVANNLTVWGIKIYAPPDSPNTDGIDPSGCQNVTITQSYISDGDDMIAMKAGIAHVSNITIANNHMYSGHGITVGSETNAGLNNMYVHDNAIDNGFGGSSVDSLRIKSDVSRGGEVYDVLYKNICINHGGDTIVIDPYYSSESGSLIPNFHDITFQDVHLLIRDSAHKSTITGYNTNGIVYPLTVTMNNVYFDGGTANDFKAPDNINNVQFTLGPDPVSFVSFLQADAAVSTNEITVTDDIANSNAALDCSNAFVYLVGELTASPSSVVAGTSPVMTAVLQNVVSPLVAGTVSYPQQNLPTGTISLLEGSNVVGTATLTGRLAYITVPSITAGTHTYTAQYAGDSRYSALNFGSVIVTALAPTPVANSQAVTVSYNTATPITLSATGSGTLVYTVVTPPTNGTLGAVSGNSVTYTPNSGYVGTDSFTFMASNGSNSNVATISITVQAGRQLASSTTLGTSATSVQPGQPVVLTATVSGSGTTPTGTVSFSATSTGASQGTLGMATLQSGVATYNGLVYTGTDVITAAYSGDSNYAASTSNTVTVTNAAVSGHLVFNWPYLNWGQSIAYGANSNPWPVTLQNQTGVTIATPSLNFSGSGAANFQITSNGCTSALAQGASCAFAVVFAPITGGSASGSATAATLMASTSTSSNYSAILAVSGVAVSNSLTFNWPFLNFTPTVAVGSSSTPWPVVLTNQSGTSTVLASPAATFTDGSFTLASDTCSGATLAAGASCIFSVIFSPLAAEVSSAGTSVLSGTMTATGNSGAIAGSLSVSGWAGASLAFNWPSVTFQSVPQGSTGSNPWPVTLLNQSGQSISGLTYNFTGVTNYQAGAFTLANTCSTLAAGASCTFNIVPTPTGTQSLGSYSAQLVVSGTGTGGTLSSYPLSVSGSVSGGGFAINWNQDQQGGVSTIDFGPNNAVGVASGPWPITVYNNTPSTQTLTLTPSLGVFTTDSSTCTAVPSGGACGFNLNFTPAAVTSYRGTLTISGSVSGSYTFNTWGQASH